MADVAARNFIIPEMALAAEGLLLLALFTDMAPKAVIVIAIAGAAVLVAVMIATSVLL